MRALIIKDFLNLKQMGKTYILMAVIWIALSIMNKSASFFSGVIAVMSAMLPVTAIAYDERAKWDAYALTMPVTRREIVLGKYILALIITVCGITASTVFNIFLIGDLLESLKLSLVFLGLAVLMCSFIFPPVFKFGAEKGRFIMVAIPLTISVLVVLLSKINTRIFSEQNLSLLLYASPLIIIALAAVSVYISIGIYEKKEF